MRPLFELQIIASLPDDIDAYLKTASCNRTKGNGWCRACAKCAWVFLATAALFGHEVAIRKTGGDMFADPSLAALYQGVAGLSGASPSNAPGPRTKYASPSAPLDGDRDLDDVPALAACLRHPAVVAVRSLKALLAGWGQDDLVPTDLIGKVHDAVPR